MSFLNFNKINYQTLIFSLISLGFLTVIRFISVYSFQSEPVSSSVLYDLFIVGIRFDARIIATLLLIFVYIPSLLFVCIENSRFFKLWSRLILSTSLVLLLLISFINFAYISFLGSAIDVLIFGFLEDGTLDVLKSMFNDSRLILIAFSAIVLTLFIVYIFTSLSKSSRIFKAPCSIKMLILVCFIPVLFVIARGTISTFPLTKQEASISDNRLINALVQNAVYHLYNAFLDRDLNSFNGSSAQVLKNAGVKNLKELILNSGFDYNNPLIKTTVKSSFLVHNPPHVIFVLMEGWSTHIGLTDSEKTLGNFNQHRLEDYFFTRFFSNAYGTNPTIDALLLNSPITPLSQSSAISKQFKMSSMLPFKAKGYHTVFLSGGHASWRNHDKFWPLQGFDQYIGRASIAEKYGTSNNTWGVYDEYLFSYLEDDLKRQKKPTFYFVLTTNNHPPVELPPNYTAPKFDLDKFSKNAETEKMLRGYSYQSNALGNFMTHLKNSPLKDNTIVVATGDHILKGFENYHSVEKIAMKYSVPAYFYIPKQYDVLQKTDLSISGSHNDLFPTLFNLSLSEAQYYNFGTSIMDKKAHNSFGWHQNNTYIFDDGVIDAHSQNRYLFAGDGLLLNTSPAPLTPNHLNQIKKHRNQQFLKEYLLYEDKNSIETGVN